MAGHTHKWHMPMQNTWHYKIFFFLFYYSVQVVSSEWDGCMVMDGCVSERASETRENIGVVPMVGWATDGDLWRRISGRMLTARGHGA